MPWSPAKWTVAVPTAPCSYTRWIFPFGRYEMPPNPFSRERLKLQWKQNSLYLYVLPPIDVVFFQKIITTSYNQDEHRGAVLSTRPLHHFICLQQVWIFLLILRTGYCWDSRHRGLLYIKSTITIPNTNSRHGSWRCNWQIQQLSPLSYWEKLFMTPIRQGHPHRHLTSPHLSRANLVFFFHLPLH